MFSDTILQLKQPNKPNKTITVGPVIEAVPADNADEMANDASPGDVALLEAPPAHNNAGVALGDRDALDIGGLKANDDADGAVEDDSIASEVEFDWQPVSV